MERQAERRLPMKSGGHVMQKQFVVWFALATIAIAASAPLVATGCRNEKGPADGLRIRKE
jgi:hypothetical protein